MKIRILVLLTIFFGTKAFSQFTVTQRFYYPKMAHENTYRTFTVADADAIPQFKVRDYHAISWTDLRQTFFAFSGLIALTIFAGYRRLLRSAQ